MEDVFLKIIATITWPGAVSLCGYFAYKLYPLYLNRSKGNGSSSTTGAYKDRRIDELMDFKFEMESNHNTDLARLLEKDKQSDETHRQLWTALNGMRKDVQDQGEALAYIKGRLNGKINT